jgi:hypothetical protein
MVATSGRGGAAVAACAAAALSLGLAVGGGAATAHPAPEPSTARSTVPTFKQVAGSHVVPGTPAMLRLGFVTYVAWATRNGTTLGVSRVPLGSYGTPGTPKAALTGLGAVSDHLTLVPQGGRPLLVFTGAGCVEGALGPTVPWVVQTWSLSNDCVHPVPSAAENAAGRVGAAWPGGTDVRYRIGVSSTVPATGADKTITVGHTIYKAAMTVHPGTQHFYVGWASKVGASSDGFYAKDVTANGAVHKMPGTGIRSVGHQPATGRMAMTATDNGVFLAACSNTSTCQLRLWKVGASRSHAVTGAKRPYISALAAVPDGRIWVAWGNQFSDTVKVTRSNRQGTVFEPVTTLRTACAAHEIVAAVGMGSGAAELALECVARSTHRGAVYTTYVTPRLRATVKPSTVSNRKLHTVTVRVTDAGDPVGGAQVSLRGVPKTTDGTGTVRYKVDAGTPTGHYLVVAVHSGYQRATTRLTVTH